MYTRCPSCSSTFRVTAAILQMAAGEVRCGTCGGVFNALETLVDDWTGSDLLLPGATRPAPPAAEAPAAAPEPTSTDSEPAEPGPADAALEFNVPENEWQRFFLNPPDQPLFMPPRPEPPLGDAFQEPLDGEPEPPAPCDAAAAAGEDMAPASGGSLDRETADTDTWKGFLHEAEQQAPGTTEADAELEAEPEPGPETEPVADPDFDPDLDPEDDGAPLFIFGDEAGPPESTVVMLKTRDGEDAPADDALADDALADEAPTAADSPEQPATAAAFAAEIEPADDSGDPADVAAVMAAAPPETVLDWGPPPSFGAPRAARRSHAGRWFAASLVAALVLAAQALHQFRDELAASPGYGAAVRSLYARLGLPLDPDWPLDVYEVRSRKAQVKKSEQGTLDIAAEIAVTGSYPVGLPMLRVVLLDRWSNIIASGVFGPAEYLAEAAPPTSVYAPGTLIPVQISFQDPGDKATGWDLDICVPNRHTGLRCQKARNPFQR